MKRMKKFMSVLSLIVMAFVCALAFTGCGATDEFARAESATIDEVSDYLDERTEIGLGNGFDINVKYNMNILGYKISTSVKAKVLLEGANVSKAVCSMSLNGAGTNYKIYAYVKDSKLYTRATGKYDGEKIDTKYVNNFDGDFGLGGAYDLDGLKDEIQKSINQILSALNDSTEEQLAKMGIKKIVDEENHTARFQIKTTISASELGDLLSMATDEVKYTTTFVVGFKDNDLVEVSASFKTSGLNGAIAIKTISEISDSEYPSAEELSTYVSGT